MWNIANAENRRGKRNKKERKKEDTTERKYNGLPYFKKAAITSASVKDLDLVVKDEVFIRVEVKNCEQSGYCQVRSCRPILSSCFYGRAMD